MQTVPFNELTDALFARAKSVSEREVEELRRLDEEDEAYEEYFRRLIQWEKSQLLANAGASVPWLAIGALVIGAGVLYFATRPSSTAVSQVCPFPLDNDKFRKWLEANQLFGFYASCPPPSGYAAVAKATNGAVNEIAPGTSLVAICQDTGDFWFYAGPGSTPVKRDDLRANYCKTFSATHGHPAAAYMI